MKAPLLMLLALLCVIPAQAQKNTLLQAQRAQQAGDFAIAVQRYLPLAQAGDADAQFNLAEMIDEGEGALEDEREALKWYQLSAAQGHAEAQATLGAFFASGRGVEQDYVQALKWDRLAAAQGNARAQFNLSWLYEMALGTPKDLVGAFLWASLAASHAVGKQKDVYKRSLDALIPQLNAEQRKQAKELEKLCSADPPSGCR